MPALMLRPAGPVAAEISYSACAPLHLAMREDPAHQLCSSPVRGLTLRSAPTRYGGPACPCGALVYPAPHGQAVPPPRAVLAQTLGSTGSIAAHHLLFAGIAAQSRAPDSRSRPSTASASTRLGLSPPHRVRPVCARPRPQVVACAATSASSGPSVGAALYAARAPGNVFSVRCPTSHLYVLPNPSLSTDPLRQAGLPVQRLGLCCAARASRPASAVGVSSNVRPRKEGSSAFTEG